MSIGPSPPIVYPDSDGKPMADNTLQFRWIVTIKGNLDVLFRDRPDVFVAGDHLIYPVEGNPKRRAAPDVYVAFGRPKGDRGSYKVWEEGGVFPQVVFEVRSPGNRFAEMARRLAFYDRYGAEEVYDYDPDRHRFRVYHRAGDRFDEADVGTEWVSPRLGVRFDLGGPELVIRYPDGRPFLTFEEVVAQREQAELRAATAEAKAATAEAKVATAEAKAATAEAKAAALAAKLRELGVDPDAV
jgi:Uma2 family endonuclease